MRIAKRNMLTLCFCMFWICNCTEDASIHDDLPGGDAEATDESAENMDGGDSDEQVLPDGDESEMDSDNVTIGPVILNEIDCQGRDWVELANTSNDSVDISGWVLTDDIGDSEHRYVLPVLTEIDGNGYLVFKKEEGVDQGFGFGIKCGKDTIYLISEENDLQDYVRLPEMPEDTTWGRYPDMSGDWQRTMPTKGEPNRQKTDSEFALFTPGQKSIIEIDLTIADSEMTALRQQPYEYVEGGLNLRMEGLSIDEMRIGIRLKGGLSFRPIDDKASFKLKFDEVNSSARLLGLKGLTLNAMVDDPTMMHETLAYTAFRAAQVPAPSTAYIRLKVNDIPYGLYVALEKYDDIFLAARFSGTDHLYEGSGDLYLRMEENFEIDEGRTDDVSDLTAFIEAINETEDGDWIDAVSSLSDFDKIFRMWIVENVFGHFDGYAQAANNYYLHSDKDGVFTMLPWGTDRSFSQSPDLPSGTSIIMQRCLAIERCRSRYLEGLASLMDNLEIASMVDPIAMLIAADAEADTKKPYSTEDHLAAVENLKIYIAARMEAARLAVGGM